MQEPDVAITLLKLQEKNRRLKDGNDVLKRQNREYREQISRYKNNEKTGSDPVRANIAGGPNTSITGSALFSAWYKANQSASLKDIEDSIERIMDLLVSENG